MAKFELLQGKHVAKGGRVYNPGDIVESQGDLVEICGADKFRLVGGKVVKAKNLPPVTPSQDEEPITDEASEGEESEPTGDEEAPAEETPSIDLNGMTIAQLKEYAAENEVDLGNAKTKVDIIKKLNG